MATSGSSPERAVDRWSVYGSVSVGTGVAVVALSLPFVNLFAPFLGGSVGGLLWDRGPVEGAVVGAFTGVVMVLPLGVISVLLGMAGAQASTVAPGTAPLVDLVIVGPSGIVVYRVSAYALLIFSVLFGLAGGILGGSARDAFV